MQFNPIIIFNNSNEKQVSDLQQAIIANNHQLIDQSIDDLLSSDYDITEVWQQVIAMFKENSNEQKNAKTYYKITVILNELENQNIDPPKNDTLYTICAVAEQVLETSSSKETSLVIKKGKKDLEHTLLVDVQKKTFTISGVGPIKIDGGWGKVRSAVEVALIQDSKGSTEKVQATYVVRKTNLPGKLISKNELEHESCFGDLRTLACYQGAKKGNKTTFTMEAYQMDLINLLNGIYDGELPQLTFSERLQIVDCIATKLEYMHEEHNTIHNDLKTDNVMFRRNTDGSIEARIIDFGLSYSPLKGENSRVSCAYGTNSHTAPEIVEDPSRALSLQEKKAQDIYAFGIIVYVLKNIINLPWMEDVELAIKNKDETARTRALGMQKNMADNVNFIPHTEEEHYNLLMYQMLHPEPTKRITIKEVRKMIAEIFVKYSSHCSC